ncbi:Plastid-lipid associated protein PAP / fibrillin family protein [Quillaja saponaria]|uniref:Plastid-lipid associated protein PAP / fibrillin family protein n=1 Tax=Quillaja saponaria TaxID=32244 RepID=A0AAD7L6C4_QUISA|nr:Plastid-lipid associated protein PAP / fibrillin family protein [Quillaja saponaria]
MNLVFTSPMYPSVRKRTVFEVINDTSIFNNTRKLSMYRTFPCLATVAMPTTQAYDYELENKKHELLSSVQETRRGLLTTADQRSSIEEALVTVEGYNRGEPIDLTRLDGTWRLQYTSAPDVLILLEAAARLPFFQVGQIFQKFECRDQSNGGVIRNIVRWSIPTLLEEQEGATLLVSAKFTLVSVRNIYLQFEEVLQFLRTFKAQLPVTARDSGRRLVGGLYYLSFLDDNMLVGRAVGGGGVFVFTKSQNLY